MDILQFLPIYFLLCSIFLLLYDEGDQQPSVGFYNMPLKSIYEDTFIWVDKIMVDVSRTTMILAPWLRFWSRFKIKSIECFSTVKSMISIKAKKSRFSWISNFLSVRFYLRIRYEKVEHTTCTTRSTTKREGQLSNRVEWAIFYFVNLEIFFELKLESVFIILPECPNDRHHKWTFRHLT